jgi:hypothetical protein
MHLAISILLIYIELQIIHCIHKTKPKYLSDAWVIVDAELMALAYLGGEN